MKGFAVKVPFLSCLACLLAGWLPGQSLIVWPGDANNNGTANHVDLLYVGQGFGLSGPARDSISITWSPDTLQIGWNQANPLGPNYGYADCDGSGIIDQADVTAIELNYGNQWGGFIPTDSNMIVPAGAPALTLDFSQDSILISGQTFLSANITLGNPSFSIDSIYGIAFTIEFDPLLIDSITANIHGGWMNADTSALIITHVDTNGGKIQVAISRTNRMSTNGQGSLGNVIIAMDDNIRVTSDYAIPFEITQAFAVTAFGDPVFLTAVHDTVTATIPATRAEGRREIAAALYPNPATTVVNLRADRLHDAHVRILDLRGVEIRHAHYPTLSSQQVSVEGIPPGLYILSLEAEEGYYRRRLSIGTVTK